MTHEAAPAETTRTPEAHLFNLDAMSDEQIVVLHRGIWELAESTGQGDAVLGSRAGERWNEVSYCDQLLGQLSIGVGELATRNPERVKSLVHGLATSEADADRELAAYTARSVAYYDLTFATGTLVSLMLDPTSQKRNWDDTYAEIADQEMHYLMHDYMTPDQVAALQEHLTQMDPDLADIAPVAPPR